MDFSLVATDQLEPATSSEDATAFLDRNEITPSVHPTVANDTEQAFADLAKSALAAAAPASAELSDALFAQSELPPAPPVPPVAMAQPTAERAGSERSLLHPETVERLTQDIAREVVEKVAWDVVPDLAKQSLERIVATVVERLVWDIVPTIAEAAVKQEIERLTRDND
jgi:hypothetical protein